MRKLIVIPALCVAATLVHAESLEEKKFWKVQTDYVNRALETASKKCDVKFTFEWVGKEKLRDEAQKHHHSPNGICSAIIDGVTSICREGDDEKAAVKAKITAFKCGYANPRTLDLKDGVVTYMGNNEQANFSDWAKPWLMKRL